MGVFGPGNFRFKRRRGLLGCAKENLMLKNASLK